MKPHTHDRGAFFVFKELGEGELGAGPGGRGVGGAVGGGGLAAFLGVARPQGAGHLDLRSRGGIYRRKKTLSDSVWNGSAASAITSVVTRHEPPTPALYTGPHLRGGEERSGLVGMPRTARTRAQSGSGTFLPFNIHGDWCQARSMRLKAPKTKQRDMN